MSNPFFSRDSLAHESWDQMSLNPEQKQFNSIQFKKNLFGQKQGQNFVKLLLKTKNIRKTA